MTAHVPTEATRRLVENFSALGISQLKLGEYLGISDNTLRKHYARELAEAETKANVRVAQSLYQSAVNGNTSAMIFWLKTRAGWRETMVFEVNHSVDVNIKLARVELARKLFGPDAPELRIIEAQAEDIENAESGNAEGAPTGADPIGIDAVAGTPS